MKFSAAQYLTISDRLVEKADRFTDPEPMGRMLTLANKLWHRAEKFDPPRSTWLTEIEQQRLRRTSAVGMKYAQLMFRKA